MRKMFLLTLVFSCFVLAGCSSKNGKNIDDAINSVQLTVIVKDAQSRTTLEDVVVLVQSNNTCETVHTENNGQAIFVLNQGKYQISASKDGYISNGTKSIRLNSNNKIILELGEEINKEINGKKITNGLYEFDFSEVPDSEFEELLETEIILKKLEDTDDGINELILEYNDDINIVGNIISLELIYNKITVDIGQFSNITANINFRIPYDVEEKYIKDYGLMLIAKNDINEIKLIPLEIIVYNDKFLLSTMDMKFNGYIIKEALIFIYEKDSKDIDNNPDINDAIEFVQDVREHGINLIEVGTKHGNIIKDNFSNNLSPYALAVTRRFEEIRMVFDIFNWVEEMNPGSYQVDPSKLEFRYDDYGNPDDYERHLNDYVRYLQENDLLEDEYCYFQYYWEKVSLYNREVYNGLQSGFIELIDIYEDNCYCFDFTFDDYIVKIEPFNNDEFVKEIIEETDEGYKIITHIDFTKLKYSFKMTSNLDPDFEWSFDFSWNISGEQEYVNSYNNKYYDSYYDETGELIRENYIVVDYEEHIKYPKKATMDISGKIIDSQEIIDNEGKLVQSIGEITLDGDLDMFISDENLIKFTGSLKTEEFEFNGDLDIGFREEPTPTESFDNKKLQSFYFDGSFITNNYKICGICNMSFVDENVGEMIVPLPKSIDLVGNYMNITEEEFAFLDTSVSIIFDYNNFVVDLSSSSDFETEKNYLPFTFQLQGTLQQTDYIPTILNLICERNGYQKYNVVFDYHFPKNRYIVGKAEVTDKTNVRVYNQDNLLLVFNNRDYNEKMIGKILNRNNEKELFAEIYKENGEPVVRFNDKDKTSISLLP